MGTTAGRGRRRPVRCLGCPGTATWRKDWAGNGSGEPGYLCDACGWAAGEALANELDLEPVDDGRIRGPEDVAPRMEGALGRAADDGRLSALDRRVHAVYCARVLDLAWVEIMAGDEWVCERLGLEPRAWRTRVRRSRERLENLSYVRRRQVSEIRGDRLKAALKARQSKGRRSVTVLEVLKAPPLPTCERCHRELHDAHRVSRRFCSSTCRVAAGRSTERLEALVEAAIAGPL